MFLESLSFKQRKIFLGLAKKILVSDDGIIDEKEAAYLRAICIEMSLGEKDEIPISVDAIADVFTTNEERKLLLVELIALAYSNNEYHSNQKDFIVNILQNLTMKKSILNDIEKIVEQYFLFQNEIENFITFGVIDRSEAKSMIKNAEYKEQQAEEELQNKRMELISSLQCSIDDSKQEAYSDALEYFLSRMEKRLEK